MKQKNLTNYALIVVAILVVLIMLLKVLTDSASTPSTVNNSEEAEEVNDSTQQFDTTPTTNGPYAGYSEEGIAAAQGKKKVLFFYANWCPSCRQQDANLAQSASQIPSDLAIFKVDFDSSVELRQKYGVTLQHTFVEVDDAGDELQQWNTLYSNYDLQTIIDRVL